MIVSIKPSEIIKGQYAECTDCRTPIAAYGDPEGIWIECECDAGYTDSPRIAVEIPT